jgi:16S rRNA (guanine966-N2)-methyltransferase
MRVIAGIAKGMRLKVPRGREMRPTSDMVREAIFDILGAAADGARVLDLFAGTGALAIEALSRGAAHAVLVERSARCIPIIRDNLAHTHLADQATVIHADAHVHVRKLDAAGEQFDLVLADPPYAGHGRDAAGTPPAQKALQALAEASIVPSNAVVVIEHASGVVLPAEAGRLGLWTARRYGSTSVSIYRCV